MSQAWDGCGAATAAGAEAARGDGDDAGAVEGAGVAEGGGRRQGARCKRNDLQIATHLTKLDLVDPLRVVQVRRTGRLGFDSTELLKAHFQRWGPVEEVLLSGAEKRQGGRLHRVRPSGFGFVVMASADTARCALAEAAQRVAGVWIEVKCFERLRPKSYPVPCTGQEREADPYGREHSLDIKWGRHCP